MPAPRRSLVITLVLLASTALADDQASDFELLEAVACREIQDREPVGVAEQFPEDTTTVWAYLKIRNLTHPRTVRMTWHRNGEEVYSGEVKVGRSPLWRTWSRKRMGKGDAGAWVVDLTDAGGQRLGQVRFVVGDGPVPAAQLPAEPVPAPKAPETATTVEDAPDPPAGPASAAPPARAVPPDTSCRALVNVRVGAPAPGYRIVDVVFGRQIEGRAADGILVRDGAADFALAAGSGRAITLMGRPLKGAAPVAWLDEGAGEMTIEGVFGPFVSVRTRSNGAPSARYRMLRAPGEAADPVRLFGADLPMRFSARAAALQPTAALPDAAEHDPRNSALVVTHRGPRLVAIMGWGGAPLTVDVPLEPPPSLRAFTPRPDGRYLAPDACGTVQWVEGKLQAARGVDQLRPVEMEGPAPVALLGVHWIPVQDAFNIELFRAAADALR